MFDALARLRECAIKPTYPGSSSHASFDAVLGARQSAQALNEWTGRIVRHPEEHTVQAYTPLSQMPTWQVTPDADPSQAAELVPRSVMLRVFAVSDGAKGWCVLPGGLARVASSSHEITSMQHGGSSADVWARPDLYLLDENFQPTVVTSPCVENTGFAPVFMSRKVPVP